jgi:hypothetical protein
VAISEVAVDGAERMVGVAVAPEVTLVVVELRPAAVWPDAAVDVPM